MSVKPLFSVIIPTCQRNELLAKCLDCLAAEVQTLPSEQYEVIVSDDGRQSTAENLVREQYRWVKWVAGPCRGPAANRNNGTRYAQGEWFVFTDDDCLPDSRWLESYASAMVARPSQLVFEGRTYADRSRRSLAETSPINETGGYLWSCNFMIQRKLFESLAGFDERFRYSAMEDVDLRLRLTRFGYHADFIKTASVCHPWRPKGGREELRRHHDATLVYLSIHPEEQARINSWYYLRASIYEFVRVTLPGIIRFNGRGVIGAIWEHVSSLQMAARLAIGTKYL